MMWGTSVFEESALLRNDLGAVDDSSGSYVGSYGGHVVDDCISHTIAFLTRYNVASVTLRCVWWKSLFS